MGEKPTIRTVLKRLIYFFPIQLLLVNLKKNFQLVIFWLFIFMTTLQLLGIKYGIPFLFLAPEYLGEVSIWSYALVGFATGGFVMAFNISSYIMNGYRFPFLATLERPFLKYCINNSTIPLIFIIVYLSCSYRFLVMQEQFSPSEIVFRLLGFPLGYFAFTFLSMRYFMSTNKNLLKIFGKQATRIFSSDNKHKEPINVRSHKRRKNWFDPQKRRRRWHVETYISSSFRLKLARNVSHYDKSMLSKVFRQNNINASLFEFIVLIAVFSLGLFREIAIFEIPAGATVILLCTMMLMITSAIRSWLGGWTFTVLIGFLLLVNFFSKQNLIYFENRAYGLNYSTTKAEYPLRFTEEENQTIIQEDIANTEHILDNWKSRKESEKPLAIFINASGGGSRAALWTMHALQELDSISNGEVSKHCILISGSSGGMVGAAYYRELLLRQAKGELPNAGDPTYAHDLSKDLLNPIAFSLVTNDLFIRTQAFSYEGMKYRKDRGYAFEKRLNEITHGYLDKPLSAYQEAEASGLIPMMVFSPSIINDGRRMHISAQPLAYLTAENQQLKGLAYGENIEFSRTFAKQNAKDVRFLSVLRMNATFPYIMPTVDMPSEPQIEIFDSGLRDNYGIKTSLRFIYQLKDWLQENTRGVVMLQLRAGLKEGTVMKKPKTTLLDELSSPFGSLYGNMFHIQDFNNDELLKYAKEWYGGPMEILNYELNRSQDEPISLSWHLTATEKEQIRSSVHLARNQKTAQRLQQLLASPRQLSSK